MKQLGTLFEQRFILKCMEYNLHPFSPIEEGLPQDMLVMNQSNQVFKVQVKGTKTPVLQKRTAPRYKITAATGSASKLIVNCSRVDLVVAHVDPDIWYIIPCTEVKSVRVWLYPNDKNSSGQYEKFRDRWDLFSSEVTVFTEANTYCFFGDAQNSSDISWTHAGLESSEDHI